MTSSNDDKNTEQKNKHERGALSAWGLIGGAATGVGIGLLTGSWMRLGTLFAFIGWIAGALAERARK